MARSVGAKVMLNIDLKNAFDTIRHQACWAVAEVESDLHFMYCMSGAQAGVPHTSEQISFCFCH